MRDMIIYLYILLLAYCSLVAAADTNYLTINCNVLGTSGCEQVKAIAIMLNEGKTIGPNSMHGDTTTMVAIVLATTLAAFLLLTVLVVIARKFQARRQRKLNEEYYNEEDDDTDKTLVNSKSSIKSGKFRSGKDEEVLFRLSMSPY
ncbi:hypothetical protein GGF45_001739 [Coemansia sp. RSA 551]|nr:hypothetical protein GGF45_001739 [Coemansia sp. RSA 551]KAJ2553210.1 hypothetical protein IWW35_001948 [Coemansia sp. RSA 1878]